MAKSDSKRLAIVMPHLYPDLNKKTLSDGTLDNMLRPDLCDYILQNNSDGNGTFVVWQNSEIPAPTAQELADAKEPAVDAHWWKLLRFRRDQLLVNSDWSQTPDVPSSIKDAWATHRQELRDLPTTVTKPSFETLNNQSFKEWNINSLMPTKPE